MKLIQLTKDMPHQGLSEGDLLSVDQRSAKALIDRGDATEYKPPTDAAEKVETIDDIPSTAKRGRAVMSAVRVGSADPGPVAPTVTEAEDAPPETEEDRALAAVQDIPMPKKSAADKPPAASGAQPAGGDAGGGNTG
jgi:hypothetical protein